jgi:hypothetical protein
LIRSHQQAPGFHVVAVLRSDYSGTRELYHIAFELTPLAVELLSRAVNDEDATALADVGRFMLYELGDVAAATLYLERAYQGGAPDVALDLGIAALFRGNVRTSPS